MIRFRHADDEKRYIALRSELFRVIASRLSPEHATAAMRDLGKLESLLFYEGTRQGFACAALAGLGTGLPAIQEMKYPQALAHVYGSADTPLAAIEQEHLDRLGPTARSAAAQHPWLSDTPMRYAPSTYAEFVGMQEAPPPMIRVDAPGPPIPIVKRQQDAAPTPPALQEAAEREHDVSPGDVEKLIAIFESDDAMGPSIQSPEMIERARDSIAMLTKAGVKFESWVALVLRLQRETGMNAHEIDDVLGSPSGITMLTQMNIGVRPAPSVTVDDIVIPGEGVLLTGPQG
jgi:hypothetical protein